MTKHYSSTLELDLVRVTKAPAHPLVRPLLLRAGALPGSIQRVNFFRLCQKAVSQTASIIGREGDPRRFAFLFNIKPDEIT